MNEYLGVPLRDFAAGKTQPEIADLLGVTQGAVSQMINSDRDIRVLQHADGTFHGFEIRPIGRRRKAGERSSESPKQAA